MSREDPPAGALASLRAALRRRRHGPYPALERVEARIDDLAGALHEIAVRLTAIETEVVRPLPATLATRDDLQHALRALSAEEERNRGLLRAAREHPDYETAWSKPRPLVSVTVATIGRPELTSRSLPSILAQTHSELEVIVAGDGAPPETEAAVAALGDERVRFHDLGPRPAWTDDPVKLWMVGATRARNAAVADARGDWVVEFDDDDAMRPGCLEALLELARGSRAEAVYGQVRKHEDEGEHDVCEFPPREGRFCWAAGMYHAGLRFFGRELLAADLGVPGDWWLAERMLRAGVDFAMREEVLCDAYPSDRAELALKQGRFPWRGESL
jgi:hypothetical protein